MFGLYINDMHRASNHFKFIHFVDDTTIYMSDSDLTRLTDRVNVELRKINEWLKANRLSLNVEKTHYIYIYMILTHSKYDSDNIDIKIRDNAISRVTSTKFLGMYIDDRLNYNVQTYLTKQLSKTKGIIFKLSSFVPNEILRNIYNALYHSKLVYAMAVWGCSGSTNINKISRSNNSTIYRFVQKSSY